MNLDEIGKQIKQLRKEKKLTQQTLGNKAGISRVTLGKVERGEMGNISVRSLDIVLDTLDYQIAFRPKDHQSFGLPGLDELSSLVADRA